MRRFWTGAIAVALFLASAGSSGAATVTRVGACDKYFDCWDQLTFTADAGEANAVTVTVVQDAVVIRDPGGVTAGPGCVQDEAHAVSCSPSKYGPALTSSFDLGDRDDVLDARAMPAYAHMDGGPGDDRLLGPLDGNGDFVGGPGDDRMVGGNARDLFSEDRSANGSDTMLGGSGGNQVSYVHRRRGVHVDAEGDRDDGEPGERDRIVGADEVYGGLGPDHLTGGPNADYLDGGHGRDVLRGRGGNDDLNGGDPVVRVPGSGPLPKTGDTIFGGRGADRIEGGLGRDTVDAGPGRDWVGTGSGVDRVHARDGQFDVVACGRGKPDTVSNDRDLDFLEGCERHERLHRGAVPLFWADPPDFLTLLLGCSATAPCTGRIVLSREGTVLGQESFSISRDSHQYAYVATPGRGNQPLDDATVTVVPDTGARERFPLSGVCHEFRCHLSDLLP